MNESMVTSDGKKELISATTQV